MTSENPYPLLKICVGLFWIFGIFSFFSESSGWKMFSMVLCSISLVYLTTEILIGQKRFVKHLIRFVFYPFCTIFVFFLVFRTSDNVLKTMNEIFMKENFYRAFVLMKNSMLEVFSFIKVIFVCFKFRSFLFFKVDFSELILGIILFYSLIRILFYVPGSLISLYGFLKKKSES